MKILRRDFIMSLMVKTVLDTGRDQAVKHVSDWQRTQVVKAAEKKMKSSSVDIYLYEKTKYKSKRLTLKTKHIVGLVKKDQLYDDDIFELDVYDVKGNIVAVVSTFSIKSIKVYSDGLFVNKVCQIRMSVKEYN